MKAKFSTLLSLLLILSAATVSAQTDGQTGATAKASTSTTQKAAKAWVKGGTWAQGFKAKPHADVDCIEFYNQYNKNPERWKKMFRWLAENDIDKLKPGRYKIDGDHCYANVEDATLRTPAEQKIESHKKFIDLQYIQSGTERFGLVLDPAKATVREAYKPDVMFWNYANPKYVDSNTATFFLFFPANYHQACIYPEGKKDAPHKIRKVCIKMEYAE